MNTLRVSIIALTLAIAVFALGYNPSFADKPDTGCAGHCPHADDDVQEVTYSVLISGDVSGNGDNWIGGFVGKNGVGLNDAGPGGGGGVGELTDLSFFTALDPPGPFGNDGKFCFPFDSFPIHQGTIRRGRGGRADITIWFHGYTKAGGGPILYLLELFGQFDITPEIDWPPVGETNVINVTDWETSVEGEGKAIKSISCIDDGGESQGDKFKVIIMVTEPSP